MKNFKKRFMLLALAFVLAFSGILIQRPESVKAADSTGKRIVVSLGDSYASGEGIEPFFGQDKASKKKVEDEDWLAHRSQKAWSGMLTVDGQKMVKDDNWFFVAASGAETTDLYNGQGKAYNYDGLKGSKTLTPQFDVFDVVEAKYGKGVIDLVTISIGGNDVDFTGIMTTALTNPKVLESKMEEVWTQFSSEHEKNGKKVPAIRDSIKQVYKDIEAKAGKQAAIIVAGYPRLFNANGFTINMGIKIDVSAETTSVVNNMADKLNEEIEKIVNECRSEGMNISFVSVTDAFSGHEAYTDNPYINEVSISPTNEDLTPNSMLSPSAYSLHPNENGAKAYAKAVQKKVDSVIKSSGKKDDNKTDSSKPTVTVTSKKGKITVKWTKVEGATKYQVVEYVNGKAKKLKNLKKSKSSLTIKNRTKGTEYTFAVKAYVNGKWTKVAETDKVSVICK